MTPEGCDPQVEERGSRFDVMWTATLYSVRSNVVADRDAVWVKR